MATHQTMRLAVTGIVGDRVVVRDWAVIRDDDFGRELLRHRWHLHNAGYARRRGPGGHVFLHAVVYRHYFGALPRDREVDHVNRVKLDCTPENLRPLTHGENLTNSKLHRHNRSGFRGVSWHAPAGAWVATVSRAGRKRYLGLFDSPEAAAEAVNRFFARHWPHVEPPNRIRRQPCIGS